MCAVMSEADMPLNEVLRLEFNKEEICKGVGLG